MCDPSRRLQTRRAVNSYLNMARTEPRIRPRKKPPPDRRCRRQACRRRGDVADVTTAIQHRRRLRRGRILPPPLACREGARRGHDPGPLLRLLASHAGKMDIIVSVSASIVTLVGVVKLAGPFRSPSLAHGVDRSYGFCWWNSSTAASAPSTWLGCSASVPMNWACVLAVAAPGIRNTKA